MHRHEAKFPPKNVPGAEEFLAAAPRSIKVKELSDQVAGTNAPVLIMGESGVGKDVLARYIHRQSNRAQSPFLKINCAAVPSELLESELFGHERGSFTGAHQRKAGKFEAAQGGTILLDEIGDMSLPLQAKLLHVLEDASFCRVGGNQPVPMDARILAATNKPLEQAIANGEFRKDLYFRLKVICIHIPSLAERKADIPLLCDHFVHTYAKRYGAEPAPLPERVIEAFMAYEWPGNVRELKHLIQQYLILSDEEMLLAELESSWNDLEGQPAVVARRREAAAGGGEWGALPLGAGGLRPFKDVSNGAEWNGNGFGSAFGNGHGHDGYDDRNGHNGHQATDAGPSGYGRGGGAEGEDGPGGDTALELRDQVRRSRDKSRIPLKSIAAKAAEEAEKRVVLRVLRECRWNRKRAASRLDICYKTLLNKLDRWDLDNDPPAATGGAGLRRRPAL